MTIPRQLGTVADYRDENLQRLDNRITALENSGNVASTNVFIDRLGSRSKIASRLNNLNLRTTALEASSVAAVDFDDRLAVRMPLDGCLYNLHTRLIDLGG